MRTDVIGRPPPEQITRPLPQHPVELVDQECDGLRASVRGDRGCEIRTGKLDATFGRESTMASTNVALDINSNTNDPRFMSNQSIGLCFNRSSRGVIQLNVDPAEQKLRVGSR